MLILRSDSTATAIVPGMQLRWFVLLSGVWLVVAWRVLYAQVFVQPAFHHRALVVGAGWG